MRSFSLTYSKTDLKYFRHYIIIDKIRRNMCQAVLATDDQAIYRDECVYTFESPTSPSGLYVCLSNFVGFSEYWAIDYSRLSGNHLFLNIIKEEIAIEACESRQPSALKKDASVVRSLTSGVVPIDTFRAEGTQSYKVIESYYVVLLPDIGMRIKYPDSELPKRISQSIASILALDSPMVTFDKSFLRGTWSGELRQVTPFAENLQQENLFDKHMIGRWKCEVCGLNENLWLNLSDGSVLCGRKFFDGSGGNNHALAHYQLTDRPLVVKLGTITADGKGDVFSYPENEIVIDPYLKSHLAFFGLSSVFNANIKTDRTMIDLEYEIMQHLNDTAPQLLDDGAKCVASEVLTGPGYTGMRNIGNSCYMNAIMQLIFMISDMQQRFTGEHSITYFSNHPADPAHNFFVQMSKLGNALVYGRYNFNDSSHSSDDDTQPLIISPSMFKKAMCCKHASLSTKKQQDACDFYLHMIHLLNHYPRTNLNPSNALLFRVEERFECQCERHLHYVNHHNYVMRLPVPLKKATNQVSSDNESACQAPTIPTVPLSACLDKYFSKEMLHQSNCSVCKEDNTTAMYMEKHMGMLNMPDYLMIQLQKFKYNHTYNTEKIDVLVDMPEQLTLEQYRVPSPSKVQARQRFLPDENLIRRLQELGYPDEVCRRAVVATKNSSLEAALIWLVESFEYRMSVNSQEVMSLPHTIDIDVDDLVELQNLGFSEKYANAALKATGSLMNAKLWLLNDVPPVISNEASGESSHNGLHHFLKKHEQEIELRDGFGRYQLVGFITHAGISFTSGHYIAYVWKNGQWVRYNDARVTKCSVPPSDSGYMYLYKRESNEIRHVNKSSARLISS